MQENAPCHTAKRIENYFEQEDVQIMERPAQSPDLNQLKALAYYWRESSKGHPSTVTDLWKKIDQEWKNITPEHCNKLVRSCDRRCVEVIKNKGFDA